MTTPLPQRWAGPAVLVLHHSFFMAAGASYFLQESYVGTDSIEKWDFWTAEDPSQGHVNYVDGGTASAFGLFKGTTDRLWLGADPRSHTSRSEKRRSVRVQSKAEYNAGLFVFDVEHMPTGCGIWSAFWMYGEDSRHKWPVLGEWDITESLHKDDSVITSLHTDRSCYQDMVHEGVDFTSKWKHGEKGKFADNCDIHAEGQLSNQGCSQHGPMMSGGRGFNARGGGTFAGEWDPDAGYIRTWFWPEGSVPEDIQDGRPRPESWGTPYSYFNLNPRACHPHHFQNMRLVLNVNLCGDLGNAYWDQSCAAEAKEVGSCADFVSDPSNMADAYWSIRSLDVYTRDASFVNFYDQRDSGLLGHEGAWVAFLVIAVGSLGIVFAIVSSVLPRHHQQSAQQSAYSGFLPPEGAAWLAPGGEISARGMVPDFAPSSLWMAPGPHEGMYPAVAQQWVDAQRQRTRTASSESVRSTRPPIML